MFDRLNALLDRFQELEQSIAEPEIIQNYEKYQSILKELSSLEPLIGKYTDYLSVTRQLMEARELLSDPLMADEAASEISVLTKQQNALTNELKILLVEDLPEVLKYKGKTSVPFLRMMINVALSLSPYALSGDPVTLLDPVCGKGTSCFCALQAGMNAIGLDIDKKAVREAGDYFARYLKFHLLKHSVCDLSETAGKASIPVREFVFSDTREHYQAGETHVFRLAACDTGYADVLCRHRPVHLLREYHHRCPCGSRY